MNDATVVLRYLARLADAELDPNQSKFATAYHPTAVDDFVTAGCALVAADTLEGLLLEAVHVIWAVNDGSIDHEGIVADGERLRTIGLALARVRAERKQAFDRFHRAAAELRHDAALIEPVPKPAPPHTGE